MSRPVRSAYTGFAMAAMRKLLVTIYTVATAATVTCPVLKLPSRALGHAF